MGLESLVTDHFTLRVDAQASGGALRVFWLGRVGEGPSARVLPPYFNLLAEEAGRTGRLVELRFEDLEGIGLSVTHDLAELVRHLVARAIPVRITFDGRKRWQQLALGPLAHLGVPAGLLVLEPTSPTETGA